jgi:hypothetical protein
MTRRALSRHSSETLLMTGGAAHARMRALQCEAGARMIEGDARPRFDAMATRACTEASGLPSVWVAVAIRARRGRQPELHDFLLADVTGIARHCQVRTGERKLRALMLRDAESRRKETLDGVAVRTVAFQLAGVHIAMTAAALVESREFQRATFGMAGIAFRHAMRAAQWEARFVMVESRHIRERGRGVTPLASSAEAAFVRVGVTAVAGEGEAAQFAAFVALSAARGLVLSRQGKAGPRVIEICDRAEGRRLVATLARLAKASIVWIAMTGVAGARGALELAAAMTIGARRRSMCAGESEAGLRMIEIRGGLHFPAGSGMALRAVRAEAAGVRIAMTIETALESDAAKHLRRMALRAGHFRMQSRQWKTSAGVIELRSRLPCAHRVTRRAGGELPFVRVGMARRTRRRQAQERARFVALLAWNGGMGADQREAGQAVIELRGIPMNQ